MMRSRSLSAVVLSALILSFTIPGSLPAAQAESATLQQGRILHMEGNVEVKAPGEGIWKVPQKGAWVKKGSEIKTGEGSSCEIGLGQTRRSVVRMKANSRTILHTLEADKIRMNLEMGQVFVWVRDLPKGSTFEVASPAAVATARGTGWEQGLSEIQVFESAVEVAAPNGESMLVEEGKGLEFEFGEEGLGQVFDIPAEDKTEWTDFQANADQHVAEEEKLPQEPSAEEESSVTPRDPNASSVEGTNASEPKEGPAGDEDRLAAMPPDDPNTPDSHDLPSGEMLQTNRSGSDLFDEPTGSENMMRPDEMGMPETGTEAPNDMFDAFDRFESTFEHPTDSEGPAGDMNETMNEIRDENQQNNLPPPGSTMCHDTVGNSIPC